LKTLRFIGLRFAGGGTSDPHLFSIICMEISLHFEAQNMSLRGEGLNGRGKCDMVQQYSI
jgi:hypothetical protein